MTKQIGKLCLVKTIEEKAKNGMANQGANMHTKNLRKAIRKIILENISSSAKGLSDLKDGVHRIEVIDRGNNGVSVNLYFEGDDSVAARCTTVRSDNRRIHELGALFIEDMKADGFGPFLSDIAMELTTMRGKWLAIDRSSVSEEAQKMWQYYKDNRLDVDVKGLQLDDHRNTLTKTNSDNIDAMMAHEVMMGFGSDYWSADDEEAYKSDFYRANALMWAFKKEPNVVLALQKMPNIYKVSE